MGCWWWVASSVLCVSVSRLDWCRASSWVQGSAFCRFSMQGRCGCSQREGGHRPTPQHTDTVFCSRPHPITRPLLHKHTHTTKHNNFLCFFFPFLYGSSVCSACLPFHLTFCCLPLWQNASLSVSCSCFLAMPSKKKNNNKKAVCFNAHPLSSLFPINPPCHPF